MSNNYFINELGFDQLTERLPSEIDGKIKGINKVHYSGDLPAVFFKEVQSFKPEILREIAELQKQIWNNSSVIFLYVTSSSEIRIYNCNERPIFYQDENDLQNTLNKSLIETCQKDDLERLSQIKNVFSAVAVDFGSIWTSELGYAQKIKLHTKVDAYLVKSLVALAKKINEDINNEELIHSILMRSIFIMYLQDRNAIPQKVWDKIGENNFFDILDNHEKTYQLYEVISNNFNGNAFPIADNEKGLISEHHLKLIKCCLTDGNIDLAQPTIFKWRLFDFGLIRIEMLSEIYENFLSEFNPENKRKTGTYYTPPSLVELVLNNVLPTNEKGYNKKILDPACGSGIFLAGAYKRLVNRWKQETKKDPDFGTLSKLLTDNIFGVELDKKSIKVTAFSLYLSLLDFLNPKDVWLDKDKEFPNLICDEESSEKEDKKGNNLFRTDTIMLNGKFENIIYNIIVGNPPFGTKGLEENIKQYCSKYSFDKQYVIPFIHKSASLAKNGKVALLFNSQLLTYPKQGIVNFRDWLFNQNKVDKIFNLSIFRNATKDFGGSLFSTAKVPVSIAIFQPNKESSNNDIIEYWAPKTFIKNNIVDGVVIDNTDIKYLPYNECKQGDSHLWKIAQWGNLSDFFLIKKIQQNNKSLKKLEVDNFISLKAGLHVSEKDKETTRINGDFLDTKNIQHYYTHKEYTKEIDVEFRKYDIQLFNPPYVGIPQNIMGRKVCTSFFDKTVYFKSGIFLMKAKTTSALKNFTILLNSNLSNYYFFLISGSWGIERDQLFLTSEYKTFPVATNFIKKPNNLDFTKTCFKEGVIDFNKCNNKFDSEFYNNEIYSSYELSDKEIANIEDFIKFSISIFYDKEKSIAFRPIAQELPETLPYAEMLCSEINNFFQTGNLKVNAKVYNVSPNTPLCVVIVEFVHKDKISNPVLLNAEQEFQRDLKAINEFTITEYAQNIYIRKQVRYYTDNTIYIAKPNQKRFWTRSQAIEDAGSIINELMNDVIEEENE